MTDEMELEYMTIGELADKVGVTVRTIQYYDQENLLKPSAKGSRNQRLYTQKDAEKLYKILCFKFMGLSITEIRESLNGFEETNAVKLLLDKKIGDVEKEMSALMKRFATLKNLSETVKSDTEVNWQHYAHMIERFQDEGKYLWQLSCSFEENAYREQEQEQRRHEADLLNQRQAIEDFHKLIAEAIRLMEENEPPESEKSRDLALRYLAMRKNSATAAGNKRHEVVISDQTEAGNVHDSFLALRTEVTDYLQALTSRYQEEISE